MSDTWPCGSCGGPGCHAPTLESPRLPRRGRQTLAGLASTQRGLTQPDDGRVIQVGGLSVRCMATPRHTPGGICYRVGQGTQQICFVGDTLFAGSIGRANPFSLYPAHLDSVRRRVLTLPARTVLYPWHGPATTVSEELSHNPFAAES